MTLVLVRFISFRVQLISSVSCSLVIYLFVCFRQDGGKGERRGSRRPRHDHDAGDHGGSHQGQSEAEIYSRPGLCILLLPE